MYKVLISDCVSVWKETPWSIPALKIKPLIYNFKPSWENSRGSAEFSNQILGIISHELWTYIETKREYCFLYIIFIIIITNQPTMELNITCPEGNVTFSSRVEILRIRAFTVNFRLDNLLSFFLIGNGTSW